MMSKAKNQTTGSIAADRGTDEKKNERVVRVSKRILKRRDWL